VGFKIREHYGPASERGRFTYGAIMDFKPRDYQSEAVDSLFTWFNARTGNPLLVLPTGAGKSWVQAYFIYKALEMYPTTRFVVMSHVKELLEQNAEKIIALNGNKSIGFCSAGIGQKKFHNQILVAGIQTAFRHADKIGHVDLCMIDETHLVSDKSESMYRTFLEDLKKINPRMKVIGLTATPYRLSSGMLYGKEDSFFDDICYELPISRLIEKGHLTRLCGRRGKTFVDMSNVHKRGGEFIEGELQEAFDVDAITMSIVSEIINAADGKMGVLVFSSGVAHAEHLAEAIANATSERVEVVSGQTPRSERESIIRGFKNRDYRFLINYGVLTTGFDAPHVDLIALCRATASTGLYVQILGRGMRLHPDKESCLVLDYGGNIDRHGPIDKIKSRDPKSSNADGGDAPIKECPECMALLHLSTMICPECDYEFPKPEPKLASTASNSAIMSDEAIEWHDVIDIEYVRHSKNGKPDSMRVIYHISEYTSFSEWVCFNHTGFARRKAEQWSSSRGEVPPATVDDALMVNWKPVNKIMVDSSEKFPRVLNVQFGELPKRTPVHAEEHVNECIWSDVDDYMREYDDDDIPF